MKTNEDLAADWYKIAYEMSWSSPEEMSVIADYWLSILAQEKKAVVEELMELCGSLPVRIGLPRHLTLMDLHRFAKENNIEIK